MVVGQWIRFTESPGTYSRTPEAWGVTSRDFRRITCPPGKRPGGDKNSEIDTSIGRTTSDSFAGNVFDVRKIPNGSPEVMRVGPSRKPPREVIQVRAV